LATLFSGDAQAEGYARARPRLHPLIIERLRAQHPQPVARALDLGCGSGLSTAPLTDFAKTVTGLEPETAMLHVAANVAPRASFTGGAAESLPFRSQTFDLVTAAGSLNQVDLPRFASEARRVLKPNGEVWIYDFGPGRDFPDSPVLADWWRRFEQRYPFPPWRLLTPELIEQQSPGLRIEAQEPFEIPLSLDWNFYVDYMLTEVNVTAAVSRGETTLEAVRQWCRDTLADPFDRAAKTVLFRGYWAVLRPA